MASLDDYMSCPTALQKVTDAPTRFWTLGAELIEFDGRLALSVLLDETTGDSVVVRLTTQQEGEARSVISKRGRERFEATHAWLRGVSLGGNEVLGTRTNQLFAALVDASESQGSSDREMPT